MIERKLLATLVEFTYQAKSAGLPAKRHSGWLFGREDVGRNCVLCILGRGGLPVLRKFCNEGDIGKEQLVRAGKRINSKTNRIRSHRLSDKELSTTSRRSG